MLCPLLGTPYAIRDASISRLLIEIEILFFHYRVKGVCSHHISNYQPILQSVPYCVQWPFLCIIRDILLKWLYCGFWKVFCNRSFAEGYIKIYTSCRTRHIFHRPGQKHAAVFFVQYFSWSVPYCAWDYTKKD